MRISSTITTAAEERRLVLAEPLPEELRTRSGSRPARLAAGRRAASVADGQRRLSAVIAQSLASVRLGAGHRLAKYRTCISRARVGAKPAALLRERVRAGDDLEDLLRDLGLAGAVHRERQRCRSARPPTSTRSASRSSARPAPRRPTRAARGRARSRRTPAAAARGSAAARARRRSRPGATARRLVLVAPSSTARRDRQHLAHRHALDERRDERVVDDDDAVDLAVRRTPRRARARSPARPSTRAGR